MQSSLPQQGINLWHYFSSGFFFFCTRMSFYLWAHLCSVTDGSDSYQSLAVFCSFILSSEVCCHKPTPVWGGVVIKYYPHMVCLVGRVRIQPGLLSPVQLYWCPVLNPTPLEWRLSDLQNSSWPEPSSGCPCVPCWASPTNDSCFKLLRFLWNHGNTLTV